MVQIMFIRAGPFTPFFLIKRVMTDRKWSERRWYMAKSFRPGQISPVSAQVEIVGSRGGKTGEERTVVRNEPFPPTPKPNQSYLVTDRSRNRAGRSR